MKATLLVFPLLFFSACDNREESLTESTVEFAMMEATPSFVPSPEGDVDHKLIRRARLSLIVDNVETTYDSIKKLLTEFRSYASNENRTEDGNQVSQTFEIRVEEKYFDLIVKQIEKLGKKTESREITIRDITDDFRDHAVRLRTKKQLETRYYEILKQAKTVKDMLAIEEQLSAVREEIESMEEQLSRMNNQATYSTIDLTFTENVTTADDSIGHKALFALAAGWNMVITTSLKLIALWPAMTGIGLVSFLIIKYRKRRRKLAANTAV